MADLASVATLCTAKVVEGLMESGEWEDLRQHLQHDEQPEAEAIVDDALDSLDLANIASITNTDVKQVKAAWQLLSKDTRYAVIAAADAELRPAASTILTLQSAEKVGESLAGATAGLTKATELAGERLVAATDGLKRTTWWLVAASGALFLATVALVMITWVKH